MKLTKAQMQEDIDFLYTRACEAGRLRLSEGRFTGQSSNDLVRLAYTGESEGDMPRDYADAGACTRTWAMLPEHRQTDRVQKQLIQGIDEVKARYGPASEV